MIWKEDKNLHPFLQHQPIMAFHYKSSSDTNDRFPDTDSWVLNCLLGITISTTHQLIMLQSIMILAHLGERLCSVVPCWGQEEDSSAHWLCPHHHMYIYSTWRNFLCGFGGQHKSMNIPPNWVFPRLKQRNGRTNSIKLFNIISKPLFVLYKPTWTKNSTFR